jgi:hypothetical protein
MNYHETKTRTINGVFAKLAAADDPMGWDENGPNYTRGIEYTKIKKLRINNDN